jgi:hypothetical protein
MWGILATMHFRIFCLPSAVYKLKRFKYSTIILPIFMYVSNLVSHVKGV